jgi:4-hydroxybenzoate polyprenyltransferase
MVYKNTDFPGVLMGKIANLIKSARLAEVSLMLGFPFMGTLFAMKNIEDLFSFKVFVFLAGLFFLCTAIYAFNAWAGYDEDGENERLTGLKDKKNRFMTATAVSGILFVLTFFISGLPFVILSLLSFFLWTVYSWPKKGFKYRPVLGTVIHFLGQGIHFQMGYSVLDRTSLNSILVSIYFSLLFSAGHLNHELIDHDPDRKMNVNTGAVHFGKKRWEAVSFSVFAFSTFYLLALSMFKVTDIMFSWPFIFAGTVHIAYRLMLCKNDLSKERFLNERKFYRTAYFLSGIFFIAAKVFI